MAEFKPVETTAEYMSQHIIPFQHGQLIICRDTGEMYIDPVEADSRVKIDLTED